MSDAAAALEEIARRVLRVDTLEVRNSDRLDFYDLHVARIADALRAAYEAGRAAGPGCPRNARTPPAGA